MFVRGVDLLKITCFLSKVSKDHLTLSVHKNVLCNESLFIIISKTFGSGKTAFLKQFLFNRYQYLRMTRQQVQFG